jgi:hypothetical protein
MSFSVTNYVIFLSQMSQNGAIFDHQKVLFLSQNVIFLSQYVSVLSQMSGVPKMELFLTTKRSFFCLKCPKTELFWPPKCLFLSQIMSFFCHKCPKTELFLTTKRSFFCILQRIACKHITATLEFYSLIATLRSAISWKKWPKKNWLNFFCVTQCNAL